MDTRCNYKNRTSSEANIMLIWVTNEMFLNLLIVSLIMCNYWKKNLFCAM